VAVKEWLLTGNKGTSPAHDFVGTLDDQPLVIKTADTERLRVDTAGNIGIGTSSPAYAVHLAAGKPLRIEGGTDAGDSAAYFSFGGNGALSVDAPGVVGGRFVVDNSGYVGIGNPTPPVSGGFLLGVGGAAYLSGTWVSQQIRDESQSWRINLGMVDANSTLSVISSVPENPGPVLALYNLGGGVDSAAIIDFYTFDPGEGVGPDHDTSGSAEIKAIDVGNFGNDIVFLSNTPGAPNNGLVEQMRITSAGNINVPGDIILTGADCAEQFDLSPGAELPEPGTVVVLSDTGGLTASHDAYDHKVVGVVSGAGDYKHAILLDKRPDSPDLRIAVALAGKVCCKVDAQYGPVAVGDLLTTSPTPGHAMKATEPRRGFGSVVGKALQALDHDQGLIPIVVALQ
jgi:hypothetical protein